MVFNDDETATLTLAELTYLEKQVRDRSELEHAVIYAFRLISEPDLEGEIREHLLDKFYHSAQGLEIEIRAFNMAIASQAYMEASRGPE
jgi:hypothetical protein